MSDFPKSSHNANASSGKGLRIALAQEHFWVGDVSGNARRILSIAETARDELSADIVVFSELALVGYPPDDLLLRHGFVQEVREQLAKLQQSIHGIVAVFGYPEFTKQAIYNSAIALADGEIIANYRKIALPNYGVFNEKRHFDAGSQASVFEVKGQLLALSICEDLWTDGPAELAVDAGADLLLNLNASPFEDGKGQARQAVVASKAQKTNLPIVYVNCVGGQDELLFDGDSGAFDTAGNKQLQMPCFEAAVSVCEFSGAKNLLCSAEKVCQESRESLLYGAMVLAVRDYVEKNGFPGVLIGLSGGIDSALVCAIAVDALGADKVWAVSMPSCYTASMSVEDAQTQAEKAGARFDVITIESLVDTYDDLLKPFFADRPIDLAEENLQARSRGNLLMALSNKFGNMVLATSNKSEVAVGYATLYGDMAGGFAPLKDLYKTDVYALARWRNRNGEVIPQRVIDRPPSAELRPDQKDSDSLPPYDRLDPIIRAYVENQLSVVQIVDLGFEQEEVSRVVNLIRRAEYKRQQAAPGPKLTARAFGRDRRMPITVVYEGS